MIKTSILTAIKANGDFSFIDFPDNKAWDIHNTMQNLKETGYYKFKFVHGFPMRCSWCGAITGVSPIEHSSSICGWCKNKMLKKQEVA